MPAPNSHRDRSRDQALRDRASRVVPGGMWGHLHAAKLPAAYPQFFSSGEGGRVRDVDGKDYVDFMCSWGPNLLGHHHPEVEEAAERQRRLGDCLNGPGEIMVELAEQMVAQIAHADWALMQKNGTDATTSAVTIARTATGRRKILVARGSYHGAVPWCSPSLLGVTAEDRAHLIHYNYNDPESLREAAKAAGNDLAAVMATACRHDLGIDQHRATPEFAAAARALCDRTGAALILDEVRTGLRLSASGTWDELGVTPDLAAWSKAIANGHAIAAVTGADRFRRAASEVFLTGSFWCAAVPMAAALATLKVVARDDVPGRLTRIGTLLRDGIAAEAAQAGIRIRQTGPVQMPLILFDADADFAKGNAFCNAALEAGVYFHPKHNMFLCAAHDEADIALAIEAARAGFAAVNRQG